MADVTLLLKYVLFYILISSAIEKIKDVDKHILDVENYKIVPKKLVSKFAIMELVTQLLTSILLLVGLLGEVAAALSASLFIAYAAAISINLMRGTKEFSCGCGGVVGNHQISWKLVLRNVVFICFSLIIFYRPTELGNVWYLLRGDGIEEAFNHQFFLTVYYFISLIMLFTFIVEFIHIRKARSQLETLEVK